MFDHILSDAKLALTGCVMVRKKVYTYTCNYACMHTQNYRRYVPSRLCHKLWMICLKKEGNVPKKDLIIINVMVMLKTRCD